MKYIDADKLIPEIERRISAYQKNFDKANNKIARLSTDGRIAGLKELLPFITSLQQEQPIEGKQVIIITETDGDANIHWDCRSLDDVKALLASAQSFIADKQVEELRGQGSGPDYNTVEGRYSHLFKRQQEQPMPDSTKLIELWHEDKEMLKEKGFPR